MTEVDQINVNTIRFLAVDAVKEANSGHPGLPLGAAPMAYTVWDRFDREIVTMRIALGADHAGYDLRDDLAAYLEQHGHAVLDLGTNGPEPVDYPDFADAVGRAILGGRAERGVVVCGRGVGASVAANKLNGIRAGLTHDTYSARQGAGMTT